MTADSRMTGHRSPLITPAGPQDAVDGVQAEYLARPRAAEELAEVMREAADRKETIVARGGGTKLDWGLPPSSVDLLVDVSAMSQVLEHSAGDLIVRAEPGVRLSELQTLLAGSRQRLAIDEVVPGSTIGGLVATGLCGPLRLAYGCVRDLLIGVRVVRADGVSAKSGGKVVKNVAGYDLGKLYTGSYGTLGIVTEAVFRLHPVPESRAWVTTEVSDDDEVVRCVAAVTGSQVVPAALEIDRPDAAGPFEVSVLVEGISVSVERRGEEVARLLGGEVVVSSTPPSWWANLPGATTVKLAVTVSTLPSVLGAIREKALSRGVEPSLRGSAALGLIYIGLAEGEEPKAVAAFVTDMQIICERAGGSAIVLRAPRSVKAVVDVWGLVKSMDLMKRVKANFDPAHRLAPGRFVGGI